LHEISYVIRRLTSHEDTNAAKTDDGDREARTSFPSPVQRQVTMAGALPHKLSAAGCHATLQPPLVYWFIEAD